MATRLSISEGALAASSVRDDNAGQDLVNQYFIDAGNPSYLEQTDRTALVGANPWNFGPPNGQQRVDDILAAVKSYFHDCAIP